MYTYQKYDEALQEFSTAININPLGNYYAYRAICHYKKGDRVRAKEDALIAKQKGAELPADFKFILQ
jgi:tetratricopeptide (TPR) repeat protein